MPVLRMLAITATLSVALLASPARSLNAEAAAAVGQPVVCEYEGSLVIDPAVGVTTQSGTWSIGSGGAGINPLCLVGTQLEPLSFTGAGSYTSVVCGTFLLTGTVQVTVGSITRSVPVSITTAAFAGAWLSSAGTTLLAGPITMLPSGATCFLGNVVVFQVDGALVGTL